MSLRDRYNAYIERHEVAWEITFAGLAICYVIIGFADTGANQTRAIPLADVALTIVFVAEFATRFLAARDRRAYLRGHWIDLVALKGGPLQRCWHRPRPPWCSRTGFGSLPRRGTAPPVPGRSRRPGGMRKTRTFGSSDGKARVVH